MVARSRSVASFTIPAAVTSADGSMRMSSGASAVYEKPRSGRSICIDETPRSSRIASVSTPFCASCSSTTAKSPRRKRSCTVVRCASRSKYARAPGSRSIAISLPRPPRSAASSAAWPPAPNVPSTTVSPGLTARSSRTSSARTGTWSVALVCKAFGNILRTPFDFGQLLAPRGAVPDLEPVVDARDDDFAAQLRVLDQLGRDHHAALFVAVGLGRPREEEALDAPPLRAERIHRGESRLDESTPIRTTVGVQAAVEASRDDHTVFEGFSELGRKSETVFVIDRVVVCAEKHPGAGLRLPLRPTLNHHPPHVHPRRVIFALLRERPAGRYRARARS